MTLFDNLMGPLDKKYCFLIFILGIVGFISALATLLTGLYLILFKQSKDKNQKSMYVLVGFSTLFQSLFAFLAYYLYRISYNICLKVL